MGLPRRRFLQAAAMLPLTGWAARPATAATGKTALVIGNAAYPSAPLLNPRLDAEAMRACLTRAGFAVELLLDASRAAMLEAIERFGRGARTTGELALFYFAGHGVQLDWRNYLLPVEAEVKVSDDVKHRCIDLALVLEWLASARQADPDKSFLIFLDACRNDPFGASYRPAAKGLSQFDAPTGSLIGYATAPGATAADGSGKHGLYTEHLLREIEQAGTPIEAALKRVRLNVRLESGGAQIPWESTSLEREVVLFSSQAKESKEAIEQRLAAELAHWQRIKSSARSEDWIEFLRAWPNGRFAEAAQARLDRLLSVTAAQPLPPSSFSVPTVAAPSSLSAPDPAGRIGISIPAAVLAAMRQDNPYSAGRYPLGRKFTVGDIYLLRDFDLLTGIEERRRRLVVTAVDEANDRVFINEGKLILDGSGNIVATERFSAVAPILFFPAELQVGKRWHLAYLAEGKGATAGIEHANDLEARIARREWIEIPAGHFYAFVIEVSGWSRTRQGQTQLEFRHWVAPGLNVALRQERLRRGRKGLIEALGSELVALRQQATGLV